MAGESNIDKELRKILSDADDNRDGYNTTVLKFKALFLSLITDLVGEEENTHELFKNGMPENLKRADARNQLRREIREKAKEML